MAQTHSTFVASANSQHWSITDASQTGLDFSSVFTLAFWFKRPATGTLIHVGKFLDTGNQLAYLLQIYSDNNIYAIVSSNGSAIQYRTIAFVGTTWQHIAMVYSGVKQTLLLYLNGSDITGSTTLVGTIPASIIDSTAVFSVGRYNASTYSDGYYDDVRVWDRELEDTEIGDLYGDPCNFDNGEDLRGWWLFDNNGNDSSVNGNNLTASASSPTFSTDVPYTCGGAAAVNELSLLDVG